MGSSTGTKKTLEISVRQICQGSWSRNWRILSSEFGNSVSKLRKDWSPKRLPSRCSRLKICVKCADLWISTRCSTFEVLRAWRPLRTLFCGFMLFSFWCVSIVCCQCNKAPRYVPWLGSVTCWVRILSFQSCHEDWVWFWNIMNNFIWIFAAYCSLICRVKDSHMKGTIHFGVPRGNVDSVSCIPSLGASATCHVSKGQCILQVQQRAIFIDRGEFIFWKNWVLGLWSCVGTLDSQCSSFWSLRSNNIQKNIIRIFANPHSHSL